MKPGAAMSGHISIGLHILRNVSFGFFFLTSNPSRATFYLAYGRLLYCLKDYLLLRLAYALRVK